MKPATSIWTITTLDIHKNPTRSAPSRCWGYAFTRPEALKQLAYLTSEAGYYTHAVLEKFKPGVYATAWRGSGFRYDENRQKWISCKKPPSRRQVINFGMG